MKIIYNTTTWITSFGFENLLRSFVNDGLNLLLEKLPKVLNTQKSHLYTLQKLLQWHNPVSISNQCALWFMFEYD